MTHRQRIWELIRSESGLTDAEIRKRTGIEPYQAVNQVRRTATENNFTQ